MKTANKFQMEYMQAKALVMVINVLCDEKEQEYISSHKIVNRDGSTPSHIWALDSDSAFEKADEEFSSLYAELVKKKAIAQNDFQKAEGCLIAYGLSIAPPEVYEELKAEVKKNREVRQMILSFAFHVDASTVPPKPPCKTATVKERVRLV